MSLFRFFLHDYSVSRSARHSPTTAGIQRLCVDLFSLDYHVALLNNSQGEYCTSYPPILIIIESAKPCPPSLSSSSSCSPSPPPLPVKVNDAAELSFLFKSSRFNRVHGRFVCPVLLCGGLNVSRSSTLSVPAEAMFNHVALHAKELIGSLYESVSSMSAFRAQPASPQLSTAAPLTISHAVAAGGAAADGTEAGTVSARQADEALLSRLSTRYIFDLMVEQKKRKMGLTLTSSEKSESQMPLDHGPAQPLSSSLPSPPSRPYQAFTIVPTPYPGCEFFTLYSDNGRSPVGLVFDWSQSFVDSLLQLQHLDRELADVQLSEDGEGDETFYELDTHWPCWERQQKQRQADAGPPPQPRAAALTDSPSHRSVPTSTSRQRSSPNSAPITAAPAVNASATSHPLLTRLADALQSEEEDDDGATGRVAPPLAASSSSSSSASSTSSSSASSSSSLRWQAYKEWSVVTLTKNYLLLLLRSLSPASSPSSSPSSPASGVSIHCVSGWDRTPLFISLLRLSLWADGAVHSSLSAVQVLYLTLAYDWCLFSHHLANRHAKREDILYFVFDFLQYITAAKFALPSRAIPSTSKRTGSRRPRPPARTAEHQQLSSSEAALREPLLNPQPSSPPTAAESPSSDAAADVDGSPLSAAAAPALDDAYFTADGSPTSCSPSAPIPIPSSRSSALHPSSSSTKPFPSSSSSSSSPFTSAFFAQPAFDSFPASRAVASAPPTSSSSAPHPPMPRGGSWTMVDLLTTAKSDSSDTSTSSGERTEESELPPSLPTPSLVPTPSDSPPSILALPSHSPDVEADPLTASWTAEWKTTSQRSSASERKEPASDQAPPLPEEDEGQEQSSEVEEEARRAAAVRCERLLAVRSLFLQVYHAVVPGPPVAPILSTAPTCPHFQRAKEVAAAVSSVVTADATAAEPVDRTHSPSPFESFRPFAGGGEGAGGAAASRMNLLAWMPF